MAGSKSNMEHAKKQMAYQTIGPDKLNQLRHVHYFKDMSDIENHMKKHAEILKPKFEAVQSLKPCKSYWKKNWQVKMLRNGANRVAAISSV
jgi:DNA-binding transcriptional MocR family regulator